MTLDLNSKKFIESKEKLSHTPLSCYTQETSETTHDRVTRKASNSSSSGSSKNSTTFRSQNRGTTFINLKESENSQNTKAEPVVVVVRSLWRDASQDER